MKKIIFFLIVIIFQPVYNFAQELDATVIVNYEQLATADRERLTNFQLQIRDYLNNTKFTRQAWEGSKIKCNFNIFFQSSNDETSYSAQLVVTSQRPIENTKLNSLMMTILDNNWKFIYQKNQAMYFNQTDFDPLTSLLDYYAYIIIGLDYDSGVKLGGTEFFQKALDICVRGGSSGVSKGWQFESTPFNRRALVDNLLNANYHQFRQDFFDYHFNGLDLFFVQDQRQIAFSNFIKLVKNLEKMRDQIDLRSVLLKVFFDAKAGELSEYLKAYPDKSIFSILKKLDPPHMSKYEEAVK